MTNPKLGEKFGEWTIIDTTPIYKKDQRYFKVRCSCGTEELVHWSSLRLGKTTRCKKCRYNSRRGSFAKNQVIKGFTVLDDTPVIINNTCKWLVKCNNCGKTMYLRTNELNSNSRWFKCKTCATRENIHNRVKALGGNNWCTISFINGFRIKAKRRNIYFSNDITPKFIEELLKVQGFKCKLTGDLLYFKNKSNTNISIDRIDSDRDYTIDNIQLVTKQANICKHVLTNKEFLEFCNKVVNHANQQPSQPLTKLEGSETNS